MNKIFEKLLICFACLNFCNICFGQSPAYSDYIIKYDLSTHKTDKPIPFDHSFTLVIDALSRKNLDRVEAFEIAFKKGKRQLVTNTFTDCNGAKRTTAVKDIDLGTDRRSDTIQIFFPPLKPNVNFDAMVVYYLQPASRNLLLKVNSLISATDATAAAAYVTFFNSTIDNLFNRTSCAITTFAQYQVFYNANLASHYNYISTGANFTTTGTLSEAQVQAIDIATSASVSDFRDGNILLEVSKRNRWVEIQNGLIDINKIFLPDAESLTTLHYGHTRLKNMESSIAFFDSVYKRIDRVISKNAASTIIAGISVSNDQLRTDLALIRTNLKANYQLLSDRMDLVNAAINGDARIRQASYLAGHTVSSDLKTSGGNVLFLDAGITNIVVSGVNDKAVYIPKLYWGVSIYFRPIDKNTRRNRFKRKFDPPENYGCSSNLYGPDYGIAAKRSIWQHLSLNIGITLGSMQNKDFDNFYNGTSLLVGPAYRVARGFKVSAGVALLKRTSKNPLISEKKVVPGAYVSTSVDIDFIQGLKDITSILFK